MPPTKPAAVPARLALQIKGYVASYTAEEGWTCQEAGVARYLNSITDAGTSLADARKIADKEYKGGVEEYVEPEAQLSTEQQRLADEETKAKKAPASTSASGGSGSVSL